MIVDLNQIILNEDGTPLQEMVGKKLKDITLRQVVLGALRSNLAGDDVLAYAKQEELFDLLMRLSKERDIDLSANEITLLQGRIQKRNFGFLVTVQSCRLLECREPGIEVKDESEPASE